MNTLKAERAMTTSDKLRGFADKWGFSQDKTEEGFLIDNDRTKQCLSDLTALISEQYYPKEFANYCIKNVDYCRDMGKEWYQIMASGILILKTLDDVYNYWKENEQ